MATRTDITVDYELSPRVAKLASPATDITLQDIVDTLRVDESSFQGMSYPRLLDAAGKQDLGGGTLVGITVQEQNCRFAFESRRTPAIDESTVTTGSGAPNLQGRYTFIDTGADFTAASVAPGSLVINWTDRSMGDVVEVISSTEIRMEALVNGTDNEMQVADVYSIFNIEQMRVTAGNLTAVDDVPAAINAVLPTAFTQVVVELSTSAALISSGGLTQGDIDNIADGVWDEALAGHATAGTAGKALSDVDTNVQAIPDAAANADAIWDEALAGHTTAGTAGKALSDVDTDTDAISTLPTAADNADAVWDEAMSGHTTGGSFGEYVQNKILTVAKFLGLK